MPVKYVSTSGLLMMDAIRETLKAQRIKLCISRGEVDRRMGMSYGTGSSCYTARLETGDIKWPSMNMIIRWADAVGLDFSMLFRPKSSSTDEPFMPLPQANIPVQRESTAGLHLTSGKPLV